MYHFLFFLSCRSDLEQESTQEASGNSDSEVCYGHLNDHEHLHSWNIILPAILSKKFAIYSIKDGAY